MVYGSFWHEKAGQNRAENFYKKTEEKHEKAQKGVLWLLKEFCLGTDMPSNFGLFLFGHGMSRQTMTGMTFVIPYPYLFLRRERRFNTHRTRAFRTRAHSLPRAFPYLLFAVLVSPLVMVLLPRSCRLNVVADALVSMNVGVAGRIAVGRYRCILPVAVFYYLFTLRWLLR